MSTLLYFIESLLQLNNGSHALPTRPSEEFMTLK